MPYRVTLAPAAQRQLERQRGTRLLALRGVIRALGQEPRPPGVRKLEGSADLWRVQVRVDEEHWRIVYQVRPRDRVCVVLRVARRAEATYRRLR